MSSALSQTISQQRTRLFWSGLFTATVFCLFTQSSSSHGQALIQKLPKDGVSATYKLAGEHLGFPGGTQKFTSHLTIRCVGTEHFAMEAYRWIEFDQDAKIDGRKYRTIYKVLISEDAITNEKDPLAKVKRCWQAHGSDDDNLTVFEIESKDTIREMLNAFVVPQLKNVVELPRKEILIGDRKSLCSGHVGSYEHSVDRHQTQSRKYMVYTHPSSPFGSVQCEYRFETKSNGKSQFRLAGDYILISQSKKAESALPDYD